MFFARLLLTPDLFASSTMIAMWCARTARVTILGLAPPPSHDSANGIAIIHRTKTISPIPSFYAFILVPCPNTTSDEVRCRGHRCQDVPIQGNGSRQEVDDVFGRRSGDTSVAAPAAVFPAFPRHDGNGRHAQTKDGPLGGATPTPSGGR